MATERTRSRCRERLERLADSTQDSESLRREAIAELRPAIGFGRWCAALIDPDTLIAHTGIAETDHLAEMRRLQLHDAGLHEANLDQTLVRVVQAQSARKVASVHAPRTGRGRVV